MIVRIGLITITGRGAELEFCKQRAVEYNHRSKKALEAKGAMVLTTEKGYCLTKEETYTAARKLREQDVDCLVYQVTAWFEAPVIATAVREVEVPIVLWGVPHIDTLALVGATCARGSLDEIGFKYDFVVGEPENRETLAELITFARAASVKNALKRATYGFIGGQSLGMYTTMFDYAQLKRQFGLDVLHVDQYELVTRGEKTPDEKVHEVAAALKAKYASVDPSGEILQRSIRLYQALVELAREAKLDFVGVKCQPELIDNYASACLAISLANDQGLVSACECDTNAALTMQMLHLLSDQPVFFGDIAYAGPGAYNLKLANCGTAATMLAPSAQSVSLCTQYDWMGTARGVTTQFVCQPGRVTLARISRVKGDYVMLMAAGEVKGEVPPEERVVGKEIWPQAYIVLDGDSTRLVKNLRSNHMHFAYGDYGRELHKVCELLDIEPISLDAAPLLSKSVD